jgi:hypothetical protein
MPASTYRPIKGFGKATYYHLFYFNTVDDTVVVMIERAKVEVVIPHLVNGGLSII